MPTPLDPFCLGQCVAGRYRLRAVIGRGGMGVAYLANDAETGQDVCVKIMHRSLIKHHGILEYLRFEADCLRRLTHPHIPTLFGEYIEDELHCLVTSYAPGRTLYRDDFWRQQGLGLKQKLDIGLQVLSALMATSRAGIVHRDVTLDNVVVRPGRRVRAMLLDYGVAREARSDILVAMSGVPYSASPQQLQGLDAHPLDDQYALGILLYRLCAGAHPSSGNGNYSWLDNRSYLKAWRAGQVRFTPLQERAPTLPPRLVDTITRMVAFLREDRFATWAEVAHALLPFASRWQQRDFRRRHKAELMATNPAPNTARSVLSPSPCSAPS